MTTLDPIPRSLLRGSSFVVIFFGGFALISPHLKRTPSLRAKQVGVIGLLLIVFVVLISAFNSLTGLTLFQS